MRAPASSVPAPAPSHATSVRQSSAGNSPCANPIAGVIPRDIEAGDVVMSHGSVNFDRTGFQQDLNICLPLDRLNEFAEEGVVGSVADFHYSVSGAVSPVRNEGSAREIARLMKREQVDTVLLVPI